MKEEFIQFLTDNDALDKFKYNLKKYRPLEEGDFDVFINKNWDIQRKINCAFNWSDTPEGQSYWAKLANLWYK